MDVIIFMLGASLGYLIVLAVKIFIVDKRGDS